MRSIIGAIMLTAIVATMPGYAAEAIDRSNPLRKVLLDAMRPDIEEDVGVDVQFVVDTLQVEGEWAFMAGTAQNTDGSPIDFSGTIFADAMAEGMFDGPSVRALLHKSGKRWRVEAYSIGATDVVEAGWPDEFGVPCSLVDAC